MFGHTFRMIKSYLDEKGEAVAEKMSLPIRF
jgi:hypothetical protein